MFYQGKKVLVTGGSGFVGTHFVEELLRRGARVRVPVHERPMIVSDPSVECVRADLTNQEDCLRVCEGVDCAIHAAGSVAGAAATVSHPVALITENLALTARFVQAACIQEVPRILLFSSSAGYPAAEHAVKEKEFWSGEPHPIYFGYGWLRRYFERLGEFVHSAGHTKVAIVRPSAVYGRYDNFDPSSSHVLAALIRRAVAKEDPFVVWGTPHVVRDFLHVTDLVKGALLVLEMHAESDPVNIACGTGVTIEHLAQLVLRLAGHEKAALRYDTSKPVTIPVRMVDTTKASILLGFNPSVSLEQGIIDTIDWYRGALGETPDSEDAGASIRAKQ